MGKHMKKISLVLTAILLMGIILVPGASYANSNYLTATKTVSPTSITTEEEATVTLSIKGTPPANVIMPNDVILIIDRSGSMAPSYNQGDDFMESAKNAAKGFIDLMDMSKHRVGIVDFSTDVRAFDLTIDKQAAKDYIDPLRASGSTATGAAIYKAMELLENKRPDAQPVIVLLTDGDATMPSNNAYGYAMQAATDAKEAGIVFYTIALLQANADPNTSGPNLLMMDMATTAQHHHFVLGSTGLEAIYARIVQEIGRASAYNVVVTDTVAPEFELVPDSYGHNIPRPTVVDNQLTWEFLELKDETLTFTYKIRHKAGERVGSLPVAASSKITYKDYAGANRTLNINNPKLEVRYPAPIITSIIEDNGEFNGGNTVTIYGEKFRDGVRVNFGSKAATDVQLISSNEITAVVPAGTPGTVQVKVINDDNQFATTNYTYWMAPTITSISPDTSLVTGGDYAYIDGTNIDKGAMVYFGDVEVPINYYYSASRIRVRIPAVDTPGIRDIKVVNPYGKEAILEDAFTYEALPLPPAPTITSIDPNSDFITGGTNAIIEGTEIDKNAKVYFGDIEVPINYYYSPTKIRVVVPATTTEGVVDIKIVNPDGQEAVLANGFTYEALPLPPAPTITSIDPNSDLITGGSNAIIEGTEIDKNAKVYFGDIEVPISYYYSPTKIRVVVPAATTEGVVDVKIVNPDGQEAVLANGFTYEPVPPPPAPTITSIDPNTSYLSGGITAIIEGSNIDKNAKVYFGDTEVSINLYYSDSKVRVGVPAAASLGAVDIKIVNPDGQEAVLTEGFTYIPEPLGPAPEITSIDPNTSFIDGGALAFIEGANIDKNAKVYFGDKEVSINLYYSDSKVRVKVPAAASLGAVDIKVVNPDGQEAVLTEGFTYIPEPPPPAPTITSIDPDTSTVSGGIQTIIEGSNIDRNAKVYFGDTEVSINLYYSDSKVRVRVPAAASPGAVDVKIVNPDGQEAVLANGFTYEPEPLGPAPTITSIDPNTSYLAGGITAIIEGSNIDRNAKVYFGDTEVSINLYYSDSKVRVRVPAAASLGSVDIKIVNPDGQEAVLAGGFTYIPEPPPPAPTITAISPNVAFETGGGYAYIDGTNIDRSAKVYFGSKEVQINNYTNETRVRVVIPALAAGVVDIRIVNPDGQEAILPGGFTYEVVSPVITSVEGNSGPLEGGNLMNIYGANFDRDITVTVGGIPATQVVFNNSGYIRVRIPEASQEGVVDVVLTNPNGRTAVTQYTYIAPPPPPAPVITSVSPNTGKVAGGGSTYIEGANIDRNAKVYFGDVETLINLYYNTSKVRVRIPASPVSGEVDIRVVNPDGQEAILPSSFIYQ